MDCYLVDILYPSEAFWGARMGNCDNKPIDIFAWLRRRETSGVDWCIKLRMENDLGSDKIWTPQITW